MRVKDFSVTEGLIHDPIHILFEGITPLQIKLLLKHIICDTKIITLQCFNFVLRDLSQMISAHCRPNEIDSSHLLATEGKSK